MSNIEPFDAVETRLLTGINLIEASAGTGKTYAIAMLVLRFVVEQKVDIKQILVVSFTKAATEELKDRIRTRLTTARNLLIKPDTEVDVSLRTWLERLTIAPEQIKQRLDQALLDIDQVSIFTIHGFCQRMLSEHALESGQLFNVELTADLDQIKQTCSDDFWRQTVYLRSAWQVALLTVQFKTPEQLLASIESFDLTTPVIPAYQDLDPLFFKLEQLLTTYQLDIIDSLQKLRACFNENKFKASFIKTFDQYALWIEDWVKKERLDCPQFSHLTPEGLINGLNGQKFRKAGTKPSPEEQKQHYLNQLQINSTVFLALENMLKTIQIGFRRALFKALRQKIEDYLQQHNILSFDSLVIHLKNALQGEGENSLIQKIRQCYSVALIDEFQDTDRHQWFIFSTLFAHSHYFLYLIGDPKQAIYKFRGADIHAYFNAQAQAQHYFTLTNNWRSTPQLVKAINRLFDKKRPFLLDKPVFYPVQPAQDLAAGYLAYHNQSVAPLVLSQLVAKEKGYWSAGEARKLIEQSVTAEILNLLTTDFSLIQSNVSQPIQPQSIAILVRTNDQAKSFQQALNQIGITAVINQKVSVLTTQEAMDLLIVLRAITSGKVSLIKQALALDWFGLEGQDLLHLDELSLNDWIERFRGYNELWQAQGLMVMARLLISENKITLHLARFHLAERRITNLHHCIELLQHVINDEHLGIHKTLDWLHCQITQTGKHRITPDEQQLRLESDDNAVKIMTMHSAKGLEFPIVFCPFLWEEDSQLAKEKHQVKCFNGDKLLIDLGTENFAQHHKRAMDESLAEALRIAYVALTRAKYRCYLNWADVRTLKKPNRSAISYVFDFADQDFTGQQQVLKGLSDKNPEQFAYNLISTYPIAVKSYPLKPVKSLQSHRPFSRSLYSHWQMSSYSALSLLSSHDAPELPIDKAEESDLESVPIFEDKLPRGAHTGNVIHRLLETLPFKVLANQGDIQSQRDKACLRYGLQLEQPEQIDQLLYRTVTTPLTTGSSKFRLADLLPSQCLKEMPFYLAVKTLDVTTINQILHGQPTFQPLSKKQLSGYLTGFIDLICEYQGQYYVIDYKTNALSGYSESHLVQAMRTHNYGLQYWIYSLVLHLYLSQRLGNYTYHQHFGGIKYLFVRGMKTDTPGRGVFQTRPELDKLEALSGVFLTSR